MQSQEKSLEKIPAPFLKNFFNFLIFPISIQFKELFHITLSSHALHEGGKAEAFQPENQLVQRLSAAAAVYKVSVSLSNAAFGE